MDEPHQASVDQALTPEIIPEDWGGEGGSRMNLSGRRTAIAAEHQPRHYQFFDTQPLPAKPWHIPGVPPQQGSATGRSLSWHENGAITARVSLVPPFTIPAGRFTADLEIFVLHGTIQIGEWQLRKHSYAFIPAGVRVGPWHVVDGEAADVLWMQNQHLQYEDAPSHPQANLSEYIPALDSTLLAWGKPNTTQFMTAGKKWLRKAPNGGGVWLLALLPHYDGQQAMIQAYNEEGYGLAGCCDIGGYQFTRDHFAYCPSFTTSPRHVSADGSLFFIRVDRDLSQAGAVVSYQQP